MNISKTTKIYADVRGLDITVVELELGKLELWIWEEDDFDEPMITYTASLDDSFTFKSNIHLPKEIKEELPAFIRDEKHLREVLNFISVELKRLRDIPYIAG